MRKHSIYANIVGEPLAKGAFFDNICMSEERVDGATLAANGRFVALAW